MEDLQCKVTAIEDILTESRRLLDVHERSAKTDIGQDVSDMRQALVQGQTLVEQTKTEMHGFMLMIEDRPAHEVDLKPQVSWLSGRITALIFNLDCAEEKAKDAMTQTMNYATAVNDISQEIQVQQRDLTLAQEKGEELATKAEQQLRDSEQLVREKESSLESKKAEISSKSIEASSLRAKLPGYKSTLAENERKIAQARREAKKKKGKAIAGFGIAALSVAAAPFTFGLSLAATGPAAAVGIGMAIDHSNLQDTISATRSTISSLESQISASESSISRLTREKSALESSITQLRATIQGQKSAQITQRSQINKAKSVKSDVMLLQGTASGTVSSVKDIAGQLLQLKQALNECVAALDACNAELKVKTSTFDKMRLRKSRQRLELKREKAVIYQAVEAMSVVQAKMPAMLMPGSAMKFLELKSSPTVVATPVRGDIPSISPRLK